MNTRYVLPILLVIVALTGIYFLPSAPTTVRQKGVCWVGGPKVVTEKEINRIADLHINWISQTPFGWQRLPDAPEIRMNETTQDVWWGESDQGLAETGRMARAQGIKTLLKPHIWVSHSWPGDIAMKSEEDWAAWFRDYEKFILRYAKLAEENKFELLCIGTELHKTVGREQEWRALIKKIRGVYHGPLTYAANFHDEYAEVKFWDALDYIGVQAYFPLAKNKDASLQELVQSWSIHLAALEKVHRKFNKPVLFTEIGYRGTHDAAMEPWRWPSAADQAEACEQMQADCYRAFFQAAWNKSWLEGVYFWKWYPHGPHRLGPVDFTPQEKKAEEIIAEYFSK